MSSVAGKTLADFPDLVKQIDREKQFSRWFLKSTI